MKLFALRHKTEGWFARFVVTANGDDAVFCNDTAVDLERYSDAIWVTASKEVAEKVAVTDTPWYNSCPESPGNRYVGELEVVEFTFGGDHE